MSLSRASIALFRISCATVHITSENFNFVPELELSANPCKSRKVNLRALLYQQVWRKLFSNDTRFFDKRTFCSE